MLGTSGGVIDAWERHGALLLVHFDFEFFPMRVHSGLGSIAWEGHEWKGFGDVLRRDASSNSGILSPQTNESGRMSASLPMSKEIREILSEEYYRDRKMRWIVCAVDTNGGVGRAVYINKGRIVSYRRMEDCVTFTAECEFLDSLREQDARHKRRVSAIRQRFKLSMVDAITSNVTGWTMSLAEMISGPFGLAVEVLEAIVPGPNRRVAKQRWSARRRIYWFKTEPRIPGMRLRRRGYKVRADTLDEAKSRLYDRVEKKIWEITPSFVSMIIYWGEQPLEFLNLDKIRQNDDQRRYEETSPMKAWPP